ncbi:TPA: hypothetical protein ACH3X3_002797 [Trebouxia sp. C0006]
MAGKVERAPFTGRPQLIFDMFKSTPEALASIPDRINLQSFSFSSDRGMQSLSYGKDSKLMGVPSFNPFRDERAASVLLMAHGGSLLQQSTADEVVTSMARNGSCHCKPQR